MIRVSIHDDAFKQAYLNARRSLKVEELESPRQYGERWREHYRCRVDPSSAITDTYYIFDNDKDYTWFMLKWL